MFWIGWLALAAVLIIVEMTTLTFYCLLLAGSALVAMGLALAGTSIWVQLFGFVVIAFLLFVWAMPWLRKRLKDKGETIEQPSYRLVGMTGIVVQAITPEEPGQVRVNGELWTAVSEEPLQPGEHVVVMKVLVTKLLVNREGSSWSV